MVLKRITTIILFFLFFSLLPGCGGGGGGGGGGVSTAMVIVYVVDDEKKPVANVSVCLIDSATDRVATAYQLTDTQGLVIFTDVFTGNYYIEQNGYRDLQTYRVTLNTSNEFVIDAIIVPDPPRD
ncbi:MAG TPA: carboxypeptidase-like regulatory domain-containing protein [Bacillota bacterium]|nr:carboxypeptidase-like regulatory domain-containing protein [Bacillota bacterium]HOL08674.1 carboxypeptidase-like regulatory domain-containing protein [Bacillota bacterium]HPO96624.1 carboxypeptidase-like regulatory domain-containing protein [Bacillota bacterium]